MDRRTLIKLSGLGVGAATMSGSPAVAAARPNVVDLKVCGLFDPLSLARQPRFSWKYAGSGQDAQAAYRITVAASERDLRRSRDLMWDSGRIASNASFDVPYEGPETSAGQRLWWRVECWTSAGGHAVSAASFWERAPEPSSWQAQWLASEHPVAKADRLAGLNWMIGPQAQAIGAVRAYRLELSADEAAVATLLIAGGKLEGVWLNGQALTHEGEEPISSTTMAEFKLPLRQGRNVLAAAMKREAGFGGAPALTTLIRLPKADGSVERLPGGPSWKTALTPADGWQAESFDASEWPAATAPARPPAGQPWPPAPAMHHRRAFTASRRVASARLYATALGAYEAWINGKRVGDQMLAPEMTDPSQRLLFQAHDVTTLVKRGDNVLGLWVGDGWYASEFSSSSRFTFGPPPCRALAQLVVTYDDGSKDIIGTGDGWKSAPSPVLSSEIYDGEVYDARLEHKGWSSPGFDDSAWLDGETIEPPKAAIEPQQAQPVRVTQTLRAMAITEPKPGVFVFDFGQNFAGWPRLRVRGQAGDVVTMRFAEVLAANGEVDQANLRSAFARDTYILKGEGEEVWSPRFTYHGFRYVQVTGLRQRPNDRTLEGLAGHNDLPITGVFRVGDPVIEKFWRNAVWSQRSNFFGLPTDCPQRDERLGWMGDAEVFWPAAAYNMDVGAYSARVMGDIVHGQSARGGFPDVIPPFFAGLELTSPGWSDAGLVLPFIAWTRNGDTGIIRENWEAMDRYMAFILSQNPTHIWAKARGADYGDWLAVDAVEPGDPTTPKDLVGTAYWARSADMMAQMAGAIGRAEDQQRYRTLFDAIKAAFQASFVNADGEIGNASQTSYILPIRFGLLDEAQTAEAGRRLVADIRRRGDKLSTGFLGTPHILDALAQSGQTETAVTLLLQRQFPSWGYMVEKGATTMWERWNGDAGDVSMNSFNHYAFGAIADFLFRRIAGIAAVEPGFRTVRVEPIVDRRLGFAGADYESVVGRIKTDWRVEGSAFSMQVTLPPNTTGELRLPAGLIDASIDGQRIQSGASVPLTPGLHRIGGHV